ncbi:hypothetical protein AB0B89_22565 [Sphaerisporangium sp. NPDC049002]|uniref:hypothetical protein n=1 Tax=Sphaerisporangium sp. NPDC049002 TaxID=3155392 RepID=UPI003410A15A
MVKADAGTLSGCQAKKHWAAPSLPADAERRKETAGETSAVAKTTIHQLLSRRDIRLREKTLWRMLYETAAGASEILALNVEDLSERRPVPARRPAAADIRPHTGHARLGYDRARVLLDTYAGLDLHQPRTAMRYVNPAMRPSPRSPRSWHPIAVPTDQPIGGCPEL